MKVSVIITTLLVAQVSASFFDVFQGAVLSVQNSFGKLLSDVVTDVKETVDCTILAVEHVLSLSHDATTRYYHKCGSETNKTDSVSDARQDASLPKVEVTLNLPNNEEYIQKVIPAEIDARLNETLSKVLGNFKSHEVLSIENVLANESEQLAGVSVLVKKELENLSNEVTKDLKKMEKQRDSEASVDTILQEIKVLEKREQNSKNTSEANEIHLVIDQVLGKLDAIEATEVTENFKLEDILKDLESNSNNSLVGLRHQLEEWKAEESRHLSEIKSKMTEEHEKLTDHPGSYNRHEFNHTQPVIFNTSINKDDVETNENSQDLSSYNITQVKETLDNSTSTRTIGDTNDKSLLVANSSSSSQNNAVVTNAAQNTEAVLITTTLESLKNENSKDSAKISTISSMMVRNATVNASNSENESVTTLDHIESTETMTPNIQTSLNVNIPITETILSIEFSTATVNEEFSTVTAKIVCDNDSNNTMLPSSSTILESTSIIENVLPEQSTVAFGGDHSTTELSIIMRNNVSNDILIVSLFIPTVKNSPVSETIQPEQTATAFGKENSLIFTTNIVDDNDSNDTMASTSLILESAPLSKVIQSGETSTTANEQLTEAITESTITSTTRNGGDSDTTLISTPIPTTSTSESETIQATLSTSSTTSSVNKEFTTKIINDNYSNNVMKTTDPSSILNTTPVNKTIDPEEPTKASDKEKFSIDSKETVTTTTSSTMESIPVSETIHPVENNTSVGNDQPSDAITESTTTSITENDSDTTLISTPIPTIIKSESETIQAVDTTTLFTSSTTSFVNKESSTITTQIIYGNYSNNGMITTDPSSILNTPPVSKTLEPEELTTATDNEESLIDSNVALKTTTSSTIESTPVSVTIQPEEISTSAGNDESTEAITESTSTSITDNDSETIITSTPTTIISTSTSESKTIQAVDTITLSTSEEEYLSLTPNRLTETPNTADDDENDDNDDDDDSSATVVMSTPEATSESIFEEPLPSTTSPPKTSATLMDTDSNSDDLTSSPFPISEMTTVSEVTDLVKSTTFIEDEELSILSTSPATVRDEVVKTENTDSPVVTKIIQRVETTTASEEQELSSTSTQSATNKIVTSTAFPPTESIPTSERETDSRNEEDLRKSPRLEANTSRAPEVLNSPNLNLIVRSPPVTITPPVNREWLTPNKINQQNYNTNGEQRNNYELNGPISLSDRLLQTRQPSNNPEVTKYGQAAMPPITRGLFNDALKWLPPNRLIPDIPSQSSKIDNDALHERAAFDSAPENTYRQLSLTTHRPARTAGHANNYKNPSFDYDSFFHLRDPEAHQRALKEARQLMANSKRSNRIINNIMRHKKKFNARSING